MPYILLALHFLLIYILLKLYQNYQILWTTAHALAPIAAGILATQWRDKGEKREPAPKNRHNF